MTAFLGFSFLIIGCFAIFIMNVTNTIPDLFPFWRWRKKDNPKGFRIFMILYGLIAIIGAVLVIAWLAGW